MSPPRAFTRDSAELPDRPGAYGLRLRLARPVRVRLARPAPITLAPGWYFYAGSARGPGGIRARAARHLRPAKARRWHIDQLTVAAVDMDVLALPGGDECELLRRALSLPGASLPVAGFGASDCRACPAHLVALADGAAALALGQP